MDPDEEAARERELGRLLREARERIRPKMSKRQAAAKAGFSPTQWGDMERGERHQGTRVRASDDTLEAAARAVGLDPQILFDAVGRTYHPGKELELSASGVNLDELAQLDPDAYELIVRQAELALERARSRRLEG